MSLADRELHVSTGYSIEMSSLQNENTKPFMSSGYIIAVFALWLALVGLIGCFALLMIAPAFGHPAQPESARVVVNAHQTAGADKIRLAKTQTAPPPTTGRQNKNVTVYVHDDVALVQLPLSAFGDVD